MLRTLGLIGGVLLAISVTDTVPASAQPQSVTVRGAIGTVRWNYAPAARVGSEYLAAASAPCPKRIDRSCIYALGGTNGLTPNLRQAEAFDTTSRSWSAVAKLPEPDPDLAAAAAPCVGAASRTCIYAMGGAENKRVEMYQPAINSWKPVAPMHVVRNDPAAASAPCRQQPSRTCMYVVGGGTGASGHFIASVEMFNPSTNSWKYVAPLHTARQLLTAASGPCWQSLNRTCVYAIGGIAGNGNPVSSAEMFDPSRNTWRRIAGMSTARDSFAAATAPCARNSTHACLYAIGGSAKPIPCGPTTCFTAVNTVERYDPARNAWTSATSMNSPREHFAATTGACGNDLQTRCIYAIEGTADPDGGDLPTVEVYGGPGLPNIPHQWTFVTPLTVERAGLAGATAPCAGNIGPACMYVIGGVNQKDQPLSSAEMYDPRRSVWVSVQPMPSPRLWSGAASGPCHTAPSRTCLYVMGGLSNGGTAIRNTLMYDPTTGAWSPAGELVTARFYPSATSAPCQGSTSHACIYVVGGFNVNGVPLKSVEMYSPSHNSWTVVRPLPAARSGLASVGGPCSSAVTRTCLYAIGGDNAAQGQPQTTAFEYDPADNKWITVAPLPVARDDLAATSGPCSNPTAGACLYVLGGVTTNGSTLTTTQMYQPKTQRWTTVTPTNVPREQAVAVAAPCHLEAARTCLYLAGGTTGPQEDVLPSVETYQP